MPLTQLTVGKSYIEVLPLPKYTFNETSM